MWLEVARINDQPSGNREGFSQSATGLCKQLSFTSSFCRQKLGLNVLTITLQGAHSLVKANLFVNLELKSMLYSLFYAKTQILERNVVTGELFIGAENAMLSLPSRFFSVLPLIV